MICRAVVATAPRAVIASHVHCSCGCSPLPVAVARHLSRFGSGLCDMHASELPTPSTHTTTSSLSHHRQYIYYYIITIRMLITITTITINSNTNIDGKFHDHHLPESTDPAASGAASAAAVASGCTPFARAAPASECTA